MSMDFIKRIFIWWRGATLGTLWTTWRYGQPVGGDDYGNRYYQDATGKRRWVIYPGTVDASLVPAEWHGWLHHTFKEPPTVKPPVRRTWERDHRPNLTGTAFAYHPKGSLTETGVRAPATGDYEAWQPE